MKKRHVYLIYYIILLTFLAANIVFIISKPERKIDWIIGIGNILWSTVLSFITLKTYRELLKKEKSKEEG